MNADKLARLERIRRMNAEYEEWLERRALRRYNAVLIAIWLVCAAIVGVLIWALISMGAL